MLTHDNDDFPSDVFVVMAAVGATLSIGEWEMKQHISRRVCVPPQPPLQLPPPTQ